MNNFDKISEAIKYIDENLGESLTVELIAEHFAFSPYYFHRLFTAIVGRSMIAYVRDRRTAHACKMLVETDRKVLDIALDCGFDSAQSFSERSRSMTGMSPVEYRQRGIVPSITPAAELVKRFTNRLHGGILMDPNIIKKNEIVLAGVSGPGNETGEIWQRFMKLDEERPHTGKVSEDGYEVRVDGPGPGTVFVGCQVKADSECDGYEVFRLPASEYASFDVYVEDGYESENNAMTEWLASNEKGYIEKLLEGKPYCVEHYDARFNGDSSDSIVEIWVPVKKR